MAGDWIKMRGALTEHPKVIAMSRALHESEKFREWLTPGGSGPLNGQTVSDEALRCVTCALLLRVWSRAREHGEYAGDDLVLRHNCIEDLDQLAGVSGVGQAMHHVGWAKSRNGVTLPNFKEYNVPMTPAEKQKQYRNRVTARYQSEVTKKPKTLPLEKRRVEKRREPPDGGVPPPPGESNPPPLCDAEAQIRRWVGNRLSASDRMALAKAERERGEADSVVIHDKPEPATVLFERAIGEAIASSADGGFRAMGPFLRLVGAIEARCARDGCWPGEGLERRNGHAPPDKSIAELNAADKARRAKT